MKDNLLPGCPRSGRLSGRRGLYRQAYDFNRTKEEEQ